MYVYISSFIRCSLQYPLYRWRIWLHFRGGKESRRFCRFCFQLYLFLSRVWFAKRGPWCYRRWVFWRLLRTLLNHRPDSWLGWWWPRLLRIRRLFFAGFSRIYPGGFVWRKVLLFRWSRFCTERWLSRPPARRICFQPSGRWLARAVYFVGRSCGLWRRLRFPGLPRGPSRISRQWPWVFRVWRFLQCRCTWLFLLLLLWIWGVGRSRTECERFMSFQFWILQTVQLWSWFRFPLLATCPVRWNQSWLKLYSFFCLSTR